MITIDDPKRCLDLNHMAIYLMLTAEEKRLYGEKLKGLNSCTSITHGIFRFDIVEKGDTPYEQLPADMTRGAARNCNVLVRLVNSIHETYCYGLDYLDITKEEEEIRKDLKLIVDDICTKNINQLNILSNRNTETSILAKRMYDDCRIVADVFEKVLEGRTFRKEERPTQEMQRVSPASDPRKSDNIAREAYLNEHSEKIEREYCERNAPEPAPAISMCIKNVPKGISKSGKQKTAFGVELTINGDVVNIPITETDFKFFYVALALATREGRRLSRRDFSDYGSTETKKWLKRVFTSLSLDRDFDEAFDKLKKRIDDRKSKVNKLLWKGLSPQHKRAYYYIHIENQDSLYLLHLDKSCIQLADFIQDKYDRLG